jgi:hypothetical protein
MVTYLMHNNIKFGLFNVAKILLFLSFAAYITIQPGALPSSVVLSTMPWFSVYTADAYVAPYYSITTGLKVNNMLIKMVEVAATKGVSPILPISEIAFESRQTSDGRHTNTAGSQSSISIHSRHTRSTRASYLVFPKTFTRVGR